MADPKSPADGDAEAPYFPAPRKPEEPSPYRKGAPIVPDAPPPEAKRVVVSRPEPPPPAAAPKKPDAGGPANKLPPMPLRLEEPRAPSAMARFFTRYPRALAALWTLFCLFSFGSAAVGDHRSRLRAILAGQRSAYVTKPHYFQLFAAASALGLWVMIVSVPIDPKTGRPADWWYLGMGLSVILALAMRERLAALMIAIFA